MGGGGGVRTFFDAGGVGSESFSTSIGTDFNVDTFGIEAICSPLSQRVKLGGVLW